MKTENNPANYRELSEPFETPEAANKALDNFYEMVREARHENHIADVHIITKINVMNGEVEGSGISSAHFGNSLEGAAMCAWGYGKEQSDRESVIRQFIKGDK